MSSDEKELAERVREKFGVSMPKWSNGRRVFSQSEKNEMARLVEYLVFDDEYLSLFHIYLNYANILRCRGYADEKDVICGDDYLKWSQEALRNFARCQVEYIYHEMCSDPASVLGSGSTDGYWIYLDAEYVDISNMKVEKAIIDLDEVWAVVSGSLREWHDKCLDRETAMRVYRCYKCDRCGNPVYTGRGCRFDVYENLLHCPECVKACGHWDDIDGKRK